MGVGGGVMVGVDLDGAKLLPCRAYPWSLGPAQAKSDSNGAPLYTLR